MDLRKMNVGVPLVGSMIMDALKAKFPSTRFEFSASGREIAAWDSGRKMWMAVYGISNLGDWTPAKHLLGYVEGNHTADQRQCPKAA